MKHYSPDAKTDYSTDFCQPPSSSVVGKLQVRYCSATPRQFQPISGAGRTKVCICRAHSNITTICICMFMEGTGVAHSSHSGSNSTYPAGCKREKWRIIFPVETTVRILSRENVITWNGIVHYTHHTIPHKNLKHDLQLRKLRWISQFH